MNESLFGYLRQDLLLTSIRLVLASMSLVHIQIQNLCLVLATS